MDNRLSKPVKMDNRLSKPVKMDKRFSKPVKMDNRSPLHQNCYREDFLLNRVFDKLNNLTTETITSRNKINNKFCFPNLIRTFLNTYIF
ncbi:hypothetical protein BpHYR1_053858 [Brachionus plicatilis]|uniref:Uncharacterized protein n=1 Tax=Brachionus plicatilis TaxID=10195 RepID=A0A3M7Q5Z5_BRAPC|nr:hypothetical protein BpHYR1_053858 [Brachionus plicatilis]